MKKTITTIASVAAAAGLVAAPAFAVNIQPVTVTDFFNNPAWPASIVTSDAYAQAIADALGVLVTDTFDRDLDDTTYAASPDISAASVGVSLNIAGTLTVPQGTSITPLKGDVSYPTNIEFLSGLTALDASNNMIEDIQFVESMPNLATLNLSNNKIEDLSPLFVGLNDLSVLNLSGNTWIDDITGLNLANLPALTYVNLEGTSLVGGVQMGIMQALADECVEVIAPDGTEVSMPAACNVEPPETGRVSEGGSHAEEAIVIVGGIVLLSVVGVMLTRKASFRR